MKIKAKEAFALVYCMNWDILFLGIRKKALEQKPWQIILLVMQLPLR